jgi:tetratricopeptide (TPR) repeat protein
LKNLSLYVLLTIFFGSACSSERNTWTSKSYHNITAHYNGYWYAREEINKIEATIRKNHVDDYNRILRLFPTFDSTLTKTFDKELQEAIKMASIAIQRHPNSKWVDDAYIQVGKARLYSLDWGNAIQTFKYTNKISKDKDVKHLAIIQLIRTYIEHNEYNNAQAAIDHLQKQKLNRVNSKKLFLEKAYLNQLNNDYDNMVRNLTQASPLLKKKDRRGRIYFIIGQVYQKIGFESEAYNYYKRCLATNPEYEVDFYARLYMAQVTEISRNKDINVARKSFRKLLKDVKNKEFRDKIYYEMGVFELKQDNLKEAIEYLNLSVRTGNNKKIDGEAYLRLGEIYYDTLKNYEMSQAYYDSAIVSLPTDYEGYQKIKTRQEILNEFVKHLKTIKWQDSLLSLASLDSVALRSRVDSIVTERLKREELKAAKNKKRPNRIEIGTTDNSNLFASSDDGDGAPAASDENADWYFSNPSAMAAGESEFKRIWGNVQLADNWRRSMREQSRTIATTNSVEEQSAKNGSKDASGKSKPAANPVDVEYARVKKEIPRTSEARKAAYEKIEEAYFKLGAIYYFKLLENDNAVDMYKKLLSRFPETDLEPEVLYTLYLILKDKDNAAAEAYATLLKTKYPNTTFAKILVNPAYLQESSQAAEKQKVIYKTAYRIFEKGYYDSASHIIDAACALGETQFTPNLQFLKILITGETEDISKYQFELEQFVKNNPDTDIAAYASKLLETSRKFQMVQEKRKGIQFIRSFEEPHYFVVLYKQKDNKNDMISAGLDGFNQANFENLSLNISSLNFNEEYAVTFVAEFPDKTAAINYYKTFIEKVPTLNGLRSLKFDNFVITKDNFDIFYRTKGLDEYLQFFEKNYPAENQ